MVAEQIVKTYLREDGPVTVTGDASLHRRYEGLPVVGEDDEAAALQADEELEASEAEAEEVSDLDETTEVQIEGSGISQEEAIGDLGPRDPLEDPDRPSGNSSGEEWATYRLAHGYEAVEIEGLGRNELRDLEDR